MLAEFPVFVVADGMGGHAAGEVASGLASSEFRSLAGSSSLTIEQVSTAIDRANGAIVDAARSDAQLEGMGTTLVGMALVEDNSQELWLAFNIGDSRLYRMFNSVLELVTTDHSEVQELVEEGAISVGDARHHSHRNVITRALGIESSAVPDFWLLPPVPGERFLLCSDGLTGEVNDQEIAALLQAETNPLVAATRLVEQAVASGGRDNVTVVVIDVIAAEDTDDEDTADRENVPVTKVPIAAEDLIPVHPSPIGDLIAGVPIEVPSPPPSHAD
jgi:protein phosphatase